MARSSALLSLDTVVTALDKLCSTVTKEAIVILLTSSLPFQNLSVVSVYATAFLSNSALAKSAAAALASVIYSAVSGGGRDSGATIKAIQLFAIRLSLSTPQQSGKNGTNASFAPLQETNIK